MTSSTTAVAWVGGCRGRAAHLARVRDPGRLARIKRPFGVMATVAAHKFYCDEVYDRIGYAPVAALAVGDSTGRSSGG